MLPRVQQLTLGVQGSPWLPMLESLFEDIKEILPTRAHDFLGYSILCLRNWTIFLTRRRVPFYATFWQLTMYDLVHPSERHNEEFNRLRTIHKNATDKIHRREATEADELQRTKAQQALSGFVNEAKIQLTHCSATHKRLEVEKSHWFTSGLCSES